jgi:hypothetical protein
MLTVITNESQIEEAQKNIEKILAGATDIKIKCRVGYKGESVQKEVYWSDKLGIWMCFDKVDNRFWTPFGTVKPTKNSMLSITCELNFQFNGINRLIGGVLAAEDGKVVICHRGRIGGGRKGIGKKLFMENYRGTKKIVIDGTQENEFAIIAQLDDSDLPIKVAEFVREVERIKQMRFPK